MTNHLPSWLIMCCRILSNNLSISQLEIDDDWTPFYGDWTFNLDKFPSAQQMIEELKTRIPAVTVWIHPFINADSQSFASTAANHLLMEISDVSLCTQLHHVVTSVSQYV